MLHGGNLHVLLVHVSKIHFLGRLWWLGLSRRQYAVPVIMLIRYDGEIKQLRQQHCTPSSALSSDSDCSDSDDVGLRSYAWRA